MHIPANMNTAKERKRHLFYAELLENLGLILVILVQIFLVCCENFFSPYILHENT